MLSQSLSYMFMFFWGPRVILAMIYEIPFVQVIQIVAQAFTFNRRRNFPRCLFNHSSPIKLNKQDMEIRRGKLIWRKRLLLRVDHKECITLLRKGGKSIYELPPDVSIAMEVHVYQPKTNLSSLGFLELSGLSSKIPH